MKADAIIIVLLVGAAAGWLGSFFFKGSGLGLIGNIIVGILGSFVGGWVLGKLGLQIGGTPLVNAILTGAIGAFIILLVLNILLPSK